jgi:RNA polymerase sigma factor (sigma-70 family)
MQPCSYFPIPAALARPIVVRRAKTDLSTVAPLSQSSEAGEPADRMAVYQRYSDAELIAACRRDETAAWNELVARYERLVYTIPVRYGLSQAEADDVFQTVWITLLENLVTLREPERVASWLVTTTKRATWAMRRGAEHERIQATDPAEMPEVPDGLTPEEEVSRFQQVQRTRQAAARLDPRCRRLLYYLYQDGDNPSYAEIADKLGLSIGSIGPIRARCLDKLRAILEEQG